MIKITLRNRTVGETMMYKLSAIAGIFLLAGILGCSTSVTTREKGASIGEQQRQIDKDRAETERLKKEQEKQKEQREY
jgi:hypothetical protein